MRNIKLNVSNKNIHFVAFEAQMYFQNDFFVSVLKSFVDILKQ